MQLDKDDYQSIANAFASDVKQEGLTRSKGVVFFNQDLKLEERQALFDKALMKAVISMKIMFMSFR